MPLHIDRRDLSVLRLNYEGAYTDAQLLWFLSEMDAVLKVAGRKACIIDLTEATGATARQRQLQGEWIRVNEAVIARDFAAAAIVTDSALIRGVVTAVFWIRPLPIPTHVSATLADAQRWLAPYVSALPKSP